MTSNNYIWMLGRRCIGYIVYSLIFLLGKRTNVTKSLFALVKAKQKKRIGNFIPKRYQESFNNVPNFLLFHLNQDAL